MRLRDLRCCMKNIIYATLLLCSVLAFMYSVIEPARAQSIDGIPPETAVGKLAEQGALAVLLGVVLYFYRRDFAQQHVQAMQYQATLIKALNDNTIANAQAGAGNMQIAQELAEIRRDLVTALTDGARRTSRGAE